MFTNRLFLFEMRRARCLLEIDTWEKENETGLGRGTDWTLIQAQQTLIQSAESSGENRPQNCQSLFPWLTLSVAEGFLGRRQTPGKDSLELTPILKKLAVGGCLLISLPTSRNQVFPWKGIRAGNFHVYNRLLDILRKQNILEAVSHVVNTTEEASWWRTGIGPLLMVIFKSFFIKESLLFCDSNRFTGRYKEMCREVLRTL